MTGPDPGRAPAPGVADPATGEIRILARRCTTRVLNPAHTAVPLPAGRREQFVREARDDEQAYVVCHKTFGDDIPPDTREPMCRGYVNAYGLPPGVREALDMGIGHLVQVSEPVTGRPAADPVDRERRQEPDGGGRRAASRGTPRLKGVTEGSVMVIFACMGGVAG
ncbi:hypothetical protein ABT237_23070 [Streptomyces sp. NPDC001581]|uniref:hypothetical protein n=1 Tax=Streptomyces sp. NPDC001581 TaxID=3154386 RepID=UPI003322EA8D